MATSTIMLAIIGIAWAWGSILAHNVKAGGRSKTIAIAASCAMAACVVAFAANRAAEGIASQGGGETDLCDPAAEKGPVLTKLCASAAAIAESEGSR